jgi:hypothetical protein
VWAIDGAVIILALNLLNDTFADACFDCLNRLVQLVWIGDRHRVAHAVTWALTHAVQKRDAFSDRELRVEKRAEVLESC